MNSPKKYILVVDDDPDILDAIAYTLEDAGFEVQTSEKGEYVDENIHRINGGLPALIILDILLSGMDGRTICQKLKIQNRTKHIPVMMISAHPGAEKSVKEVGADDFLAKPFDIHELITKMEKLLM